MKHFIFILLFTFSLASNSQDLRFETIRKISEEHNCKLPPMYGWEDKNFFLITPEYILYWCQQKEPDIDYYNIILVDSNKTLGTCNGLIPVQALSPSPIWIDKAPTHYNNPLYTTEFWYLSKYTSEGENIIVKEKNLVAGPSITYGFFDMGQILHCHNNEWVMYGYH